MVLGPENSLSLPDAGGAGADEEQRRKEQQVRLLQDWERGGGLPIEGEFFYHQLERVRVREDGGVKDLVVVLEKVRAYLEGLPGDALSFLVEFNPNDPNNVKTRQALAFLRRLFLTTEGSSERPDALYVKIASKQAVEQPLVRSDSWRKDPDAYRESRHEDFERINKNRLLDGEDPIPEEIISGIIQEEEKRLSNEYLAREKLLGLLNHLEARESVDLAFRQRMATCENPEQASKLGGEIRAVSPDGPEWGLFFHTEAFGSKFGENVDKILEEIVKFGLTEGEIKALGMEDLPNEVRKKVCGKLGSVYASGFRNDTAFAYFIDHLLKKADGRLDVVWAAWRLSLLWEIPEYLGVDKQIDSKDRFERWSLAAPPLGNALMGVLMHTREKRMHEFGLDANGKRFQVERFISHSGLPLTIDVFEHLCLDFLHETTIAFSRDYLDLDSDFGRKLREILNNIKQNINKLPPGRLKDEKLYKKIGDFLDGEADSIKVSLWDLRFLGGWKFSDPTFPWLISDQPLSEDAEAGELPMGAFGAWLLKRSRAFSVWSGRDGQGIKDIPRLDNLATQEFYYGALRNWAKVLGNVSLDDPPEKNPRAWVLLAWLNYYRPGLANEDSPVDREKPGVRMRSQRRQVFQNASYPERGIGLNDVLEAAMTVGWIRAKDANWIIGELGIRANKYKTE